MDHLPVNHSLLSIIVHFALALSDGSGSSDFICNTVCIASQARLSFLAPPFAFVGLIVCVCTGTLYVLAGVFHHSQLLIALAHVDSES